MAVNGKSIWERFDNGVGQIHLLGFNFDLNWTDLPVRATYISFIDQANKFKLKTSTNKTFFSW